MKLIRQKSNFLGVFMATLMLLIAVPYQTILTAMIPTESRNDTTGGQDAREFLNGLISREDIQHYLTNQGIDPIEVKTRVESLSNSEAVMMAEQLERLSAGGNAVGAIIGVALIVFLVSLVTDILGYTDVFPFVKCIEIRKDPSDPGVGLWQLEKLIGWPEKILAFHTWYLKEKGVD